MSKLVGQALIDFVKQHQGADRDAVIQDAGYVSMRKGRPSLQRTSFFQALSMAQGLDIGPTIVRDNKGKDPSYRLKVGPKGLVPVGSAYTTQIGLNQGDYVKVIVEDDCLILEPDAEVNSQPSDLPFAV